MNKLYTGKITNGCLAIAVMTMLCGTAWADLIKCPEGYKQSYLPGGMTECIVKNERDSCDGPQCPKLQPSKRSLYLAKCEEYLEKINNPDIMRSRAMNAQIATAYCTRALLE